MKLTINSKNYGGMDFTMNDNGGYIRCNGKQICKGGGYMGSTISGSPEGFELTCKKWWNQQRAELNEYG